ncbi:putative cytokinin 7-beta-glucosyltransferase [Helianthus annuus]|nr:putative cytokinin 7-beta-glucosyltransferase [Helianthus annuus]
MAEHGGQRRRLVMVPSPLQGHMTPMLQLATYLHSQNFSTTIAHSDFNPPNSSNHPYLTFLPLPTNTSGTDISAGFTNFFKTLNNNCKTHLHNHLIQIINAQNNSFDKESVVVIHENLTIFVGIVVDNLGSPAILLRGSSAAFFPNIKSSRLHICLGLMEEEFW